MGVTRVWGEGCWWRREGPSVHYVQPGALAEGKELKNIIH